MKANTCSFLILHHQYPLFSCSICHYQPYLPIPPNCNHCSFLHYLYGYPHLPHTPHHCHCFFHPLMQCCLLYANCHNVSAESMNMSFKSNTSLSWISLSPIILLFSPIPCYLHLLQHLQTYFCLHLYLPFLSVITSHSLLWQLAQCHQCEHEHGALNALTHDNQFLARHQSSHKLPPPVNSFPLCSLELG